MRNSHGWLNHHHHLQRNNVRCRTLWCCGCCCFRKNLSFHHMQQTQPWTAAGLTRAFQPTTEKWDPCHAHCPKTEREVVPCSFSLLGRLLVPAEKLNRMLASAFYLGLWLRYTVERAADGAKLWGEKFLMELVYTNLNIITGGTLKKNNKGRLLSSIY